ncbi:TonB-dependent receptor [Sphingopyxis macrogoltabida]|uniref:TonB-dependent receptor-like beta-barrel domain-containing protein n=1 Tax=Sphingopyxis macrogoltabida TaxID=33050 RepID=A0AAC9FFZ3_SPHMC|nr:TonB-dependent receptor [Sphingopyxis macrogoltabida]ALJ14698.1 hypothetical protein LH19_17655 [Sphingopyxis macrogoltabida]AMU90956.1 hypothetical protein ATM17_18225 [Sphingopyxis macrogoltabida]
MEENQGVTSPQNNPDMATIWGFEVAVEKRLTFLPGVLSGLGVYANYTFSRSKKTQTLSWFTAPVYDSAGNVVNRETVTYERQVPFDLSPENSGTIGLTYTRPGLDASLYYTAQARRLGAAQAFEMDSYREATSSLDFRAVYGFRLAGSDVRLSLEGNDLLKGKKDALTEDSIGGVNGGPKYYTGGYYHGGRRVTVGLSASF